MFDPWLGPVVLSSAGSHDPLPCSIKVTARRSVPTTIVVRRRVESPDTLKASRLSEFGAVERARTKLYNHLIPKRLLPLVPDASGSNQLFCWSMGNGPFVNDSVNHSLALRIKRHMPNTGNVVPIEPVAVDRFQLDLAATRDQWQPDES